VTDFEDMHGPETCTYRECKLKNPKVPCPFVRDEQVVAVMSCPECGKQLSGLDGLIDHNCPRTNPIIVSKVHEHQYTIPVEWGSGSTRHQHAVTKLRCVCGEEIERT